MLTSDEKILKMRNAFQRLAIIETEIGNRETAQVALRAASELRDSSLLKIWEILNEQ